MRPTCYVLLGVITLGLLTAPLLGFANQPALWFGLPSLMVWMGILVVLITPTLAVLEYTRGPDDEPPAAPAAEVTSTEGGAR